MDIALEQKLFESPQKNFLQKMYSELKEKLQAKWF